MWETCYQGFGDYLAQFKAFDLSLSKDQLPAFDQYRSTDLHPNVSYDSFSSLLPASMEVSIQFEFLVLAPLAALGKHSA